MDKENILKQIRGGLIVSCQALKGEPLYGADVMAKMALAAQVGGAVGIRANYAQDIRAIKDVVNVPVIGLVKKHYEDSLAYITPTMVEVEEVVNAGADIVAVDATMLKKPQDKSTADFIYEIKEKFDIMVLADVSIYDEGIEAQQAGADIISTALAGYTPYSIQTEEPDFELISRLSKDLSIPLAAEGRIWTPEQAVQALKFGAFSVVVGTAITRPQEITKRFVRAISEVSEKNIR